MGASILETIQLNMNAFVLLSIFIVGTVQADGGFRRPTVYDGPDAEFVRARVVPRAVLDSHRLVKEVYVDRVKPMAYRPLYQEHRVADVPAFDDYSYGGFDHGFDHEYVEDVDYAVPVADHVGYGPSHRFVESRPSHVIERPARLVRERFSQVGRPRRILHGVSTRRHGGY